MKTVFRAIFIYFFSLIVRIIASGIGEVAHEALKNNFGWAVVIAFFGVLYLVLSYLRSRAETRDSAWPSTKFTAGLIASMAFGLAGYLWTIVVTAYHLPPAIGESMIACGTAFYARQAKDTWEDASDNKQRRPREIAKDTIRDLPKDILDAAGNSIRENIL